MNEISGPNRELIDVLNMAREASGVSTFAVGDFASAEALNDFILDERGREFHTEAIRRQDSIRHENFVEMAVARRKPAKAFHVRYPIP